MKTSIIIPVRDRPENLDCVLTSLRAQRSHHEFEIVVVDDRSLLDIKSVADKHGAVYTRVMGTHNSWNASIPRNLGAKMAGGELLWFLDSDVLLPWPAVVERTITEFLKGNRSRVLIGSYHWLPAQVITPQDVLERFESIVNGDLPPLKIQKKGMIGMKDIRQVSFDKAGNSQAEFYSFTDGLACFGGYLLMTKQTFWAAGGYDESMLAGVEDGDFGITLFEMGVRYSYLKDVCGYHMAHEQPPGRDQNVIAREVQRLNDKHHVDMIHESGKAYRRWGIDWTPPPEFYGGDPQRLEEYKKLWKESPMEFMLKINKV